MSNIIDVQVTAQTTSEQRDCLSLAMTPLRIPRRRYMSFLRVLLALRGLYTRRRPVESRWMNPAGQRWETPTDCLARTEPYLYIHSLSR
jgi:hypothetical protein